MGKSIRVAHVVGKMVGGGVEAVVMNYYRHIDRDRVQFDFIIDSDSTVVPAEEIKDLGGRLFEVPPYQRLGEYQRALGELLTRNAYPIVHSHINTLSVFPLRVAKKVGVPVRIAHSHSTSGKGELVRNAAKQILRTQANRYPTVRMACTEHAGRWLYGSKPFEVIPNPIDFRRFSFDSKARIELRRFWDVADSEILIGHVGRWAPPKNQAHLLRVLKRLLDMGVKARLVLVGDGPDKPTIELEAERLGVARYIVAPGCIDAARAYSAFDVFCFPSRYEGLGMAAMEAQAAGLPCLVSNAVPSEVDLTGHVTFLPFDDVDLWANAIANVVEDAPLRQVDCSGEKFRKHDPDTVATQLMKRYLQLESEADR